MVNGASQEGKTRVLLGATGAISVVNLPLYIQAFRQKNWDLRAIVTPAADRILPASTVDRFCPAYDGGDFSDARHVNLALWAEIVVVLPCTAHTLAALACGLTFNLLHTTALAHEMPLLIFPMMNASMWSNQIVQRNVGILEDSGHRVVRPEQGSVFEVATRTDINGLQLANPRDASEIVADTLSQRRTVRSTAN